MGSVRLDSGTCTVLFVAVGEEWLIMESRMTTLGDKYCKIPLAFRYVADFLHFLR